MDAQRSLSPVRVDPEYLALLEGQDWDGLFDEMVYYALRKASGKIWLGGKRSYARLKEPMLAGGSSPEDIVQEVFSQVLKGKGDAKWDPARNADIRPLLRSRIDGKLSDLAKKLDNKKRVPVPKDADGSERLDWLEAGKVADRGLAEDTYAGDAEENGPADDVDRLSAAWHEEHSGESSWIDALEKDLGDDSPLLNIFKYVGNGTPSRRIAKALEISIKEVNNSKKRFRRKSRQFWQTGTPKARKTNA